MNPRRFSKSWSRREFLRSAGALVAASTAAGLLSSSTAKSASQQVDSRPNVVLILTDDQGWGDIHCHGNRLLDTPVLDRLAAEGARFERFFVSPLCAPTRASLLTGRYYLRTGTHGVTRGYETMRSEEVTLAEAFKQAGYVTGCFGKWHNGAHWPYDPNGQGFDKFLGFCAGHWNNYFDTTLQHNGRFVKTRGYITDVLTDAVLDFITLNRNRPFFCYVPYNAPHSPFQVPDAYFDKYKRRGLDDKLACIYGMVENIDHNVGRILKHIAELGLREKTIVVFLTDNGPNSDRFNGKMRGRKGSVHEGGVRVPLFIRWPGRIPAGLRIEQITADIDIFPTLVELCGIAMPRTLLQDGVSLAALLEGRAVTWPERMLFTFRCPGAAVNSISGAVRTPRWRAVRTGKRWELYDMVKDPGEQNNVAKVYPDVVERLREAFETTVREVTKAGFEPIAVPVGYPERPVVTLPAHEAFLHPRAGQGISYKGKAGWANDYVTNWTSVDAYCWWPIEVVRNGRYEVVLMYVCRQEDVGVHLRVELGGKVLEVVVDRAHDPAPIPSPDRVPRVEVYEKIWARLPAGQVDLVKGPGRLVVKVSRIVGKRAIDLKAVELRRIG